MITPWEFSEQWGEQGLVRFPAEVVDTLSVPGFNKRFLVEAGLPRQAPFPGMQGFTLLPPANPPQAQTGCEDFNLLEQVGRFRLLAVTTYRLFIAIDERRQGRVVRHCESGLRCGRGYFMNSSIPQLAESLLAYRVYNQRCHEWDPQGEERPQSFVDDLEREIERIDPEAMAYTVDSNGERHGGYWPVNTIDCGF